MIPTEPQSPRDRNPRDPERFRSLVLEYQRAVARGEQPDRRDLLDSNPDLRLELEAFFVGVDLERSAEPVARPEGPLDGADPEATQDVVFDPDATIATPPAAGSPPVASGPSTSGPPRERVGSYRLLRELGRGGMGVVYEAEQDGTGRRLALKLLSQDLPKSGETVERFLREARLAASFSHPNSTFIYDAGEDAGLFYIAMELVPGRTLQDVVESDGPMPLERAVDAVLDIADGLEAAHRSGIVHRDVKPSNCFVDEDGGVKIGDFGLSKSLVLATDLTQTGSFLGTPLFAAPEQARGDSVNARTDVYALGATLYYLLTGRGPFTGDAAAVIAKIVADAPEPLRSVRGEVPAAVSEIVDRSLEKVPANRHASMLELRQALLPFGSGGTSIAEIGIRLAAYFIDSTIGTVIGSVLGWIAVAILQTANILQDPSNTIRQLSWALVSVLYFTLCEGRWGRGIGKRLVGLRVTDLAGNPPGLKRCLLRALIVPGLTLVPILVLDIIEQSHLQFDTWGLYRTTITAMLGWLIGLLFLSTMRKSNSYRGLHELLSGTRVGRPRVTELDPAEEISWTAPVRLDGLLRRGSYSLTGTWDAPDGNPAWLGQDDNLGRSVWVYACDDLSPSASSERVGVLRRCRPFWLQGGQDDDQPWDAFEAVEGAPFVHLLMRPGGLSPEIVVGVLRELAEELLAAIDDGSLPASLSEGHVWVDRTGHLQLIDRPVVRAQWPESATARSRASRAAGAAGRAALLFQGLARRVLETSKLSGTVIDALVRIDGVESPDREILEHAARDLAGSEEKRQELTWAERLGVLAVAWSVEQTVYYGIGFLIGQAISGLWLTSPWLALGISLATAVTVSFAGGALFRGGPVFRLCGVEVRRQRGQLASRARCGLRSVFAWTCAILASIATAHVFNRTLAASTEGNISIRGMALLLGLALLVLTGLQFFGAVYAVLRPRQGLQDFLASTRLVLR